MSATAIVEHDLIVHCGDVQDVLAAMPDESVHCVVTSPPYYGLRDYGVAGQLGLEASPSEYVATMAALFREIKRVLADDGVLWLNIGDSYATTTKGSGGVGRSTLGAESFGNSMSPEAVLRSQLRQQMPVRRFEPDRSPKNLLGIPWRLAFALQDDGWTLRRDIIWHKTNPMPESVTDRPSNAHEYLFLLTKSPHYWFDLDAIRVAHAEKTVRDFGDGRSNGKAYGNVKVRDNNWQPNNKKRVLHPVGANPGDVWSIASTPYVGAHFATFPPEIPRRCILAGCPEGGTVLDPFAGSGTTLMVARQLGRRSIGIELNAEYVEIIRERVGPTPLEFGALA